MAVKLSDISTRVVLHAPEVSEPLAQMVLKDAAAEFCIKTSCWQHDCGGAKLIKNGAEYDLDIPAQARIASVLNVWVAGRELAPSGPSQLASYGDWQTATGTPTHYFLTDVGVIRVVPIPEAVASFSVRIACAPTFTATTLPDFLVEQHIEALTHGALARLMVLPNQPWSNAQAAMYHAEDFAKSCAKARSQVATGYSKKTLTVSMQSF